MSTSDDVTDDATVDAALHELFRATQLHLAAVRAASAPNDPAVSDAFGALSDAALAYDDAVFEAYGDVTPFADIDALDDEDDDEDSGTDTDTDDELDHYPETATDADDDDLDDIEIVERV